MISLDLSQVFRSEPDHCLFQSFNMLFLTLDYVNPYIGLFFPLLSAKHLAVELEILHLHMQAMQVFSETEVL